MNYNNKTESLDKILLAKGLITHSQLTAALQYQCRLPKSQSLQLDEVLVALGYLTPEQIQVALGEKKPQEDVLVQVLVREGSIQEDQLSEALKARDDSTQEKRLGTVLMELGHTNKEVIEEALKHYYLFYQNKTEQEQSPAPPPPPTDPLSLQPLQNATPLQEKAAKGPEQRNPIGEKLIAKGYITTFELQDAIDYQFRLPRILHKPIGEILIHLGYITQEHLDEVLSEHQAPPKHALGQILIHKKIITQWQLSHVMTLKYMPEHQHKKIGQLLVEMGYAKRPDIEVALKAHFQEKGS